MSFQLNLLPASINKDNVGSVDIDKKEREQFNMHAMRTVLGEIASHLINQKYYYGPSQLQPPLSATRLTEIICRSLVDTANGSTYELYRCYDSWELCFMINTHGCDYYNVYYADLACAAQRMISLRDFSRVEECFEIQNCRSLIDSRHVFVENFSWAVPTTEAINEICKFASGELILEVGAGLCFWAFLIRLNAQPIFASDTFTTHGTKRSKCFLDDVFVMDGVQAVQTNRTNVLFMCWPSYKDPMAYSALRAFTGNKFIYIGEGYGGCTANDEFFSLLDEEWECVSIHDIPCWFGIYDSLSFYVRKEKTNAAQPPVEEPWTLVEKNPVEEPWTLVESIPVEEPWTLVDYKKVVKPPKPIKKFKTKGVQQSSKKVQQSSKKVQPSAKQVESSAKQVQPSNRFTALSDDEC